MGPAAARTKDFAAGGVTEAVSKLNPDQVTADLNAARRLRQKASVREQQTIRGRGSAGAADKLSASPGNRADLSAAYVFYGPPAR